MLISRFCRNEFRGIFLATIIGLASKFLGEHYTVPSVLFALLIGLSFHFSYSDKHLRDGIDLTADFLLKLAVGLLGFRLTFANLQSIGLSLITAIVFTVFLTIGFGIILAKIFGKDKDFGILSGGATAICGVSAAIAICSFMPKSKHRNRDMAIVIVGVTVLSTLSMILYPILFKSLGMTDVAAGFVLGASIHDVAQVVGAGYSISDDAGITATFIKMIRVSLLPILIIGLLIRSNRSKGKNIKLPWFLILFFVMAISKNLIAIPKFIDSSIEFISSWLLIISIAAIGVRTSLASVTSVSYVYGAILILETGFLLSISLALLNLLTFFSWPKF